MDEKSSDDYIISQLKNNRNFPNRNFKNNYNLNTINKEFKTKFGPIPSGKDPKDMDDISSAEEVGKYLKELYKNYKDAKSKGEVLKFVKSNIKELFALSLYFESIETVNLLINLFLYELEKDKVGDFHV